MRRCRYCSKLQYSRLQQTDDACCVVLCCVEFELLYDSLNPLVCIYAYVDVRAYVLCCTVLCSALLYSTLLKNKYKLDSAA